MSALTLNEELELVAEAVGQLEPATVEQVREALGQPWERRGTVRNRLYELEEAGVLISDEGRPVRFAINHLGSEHDYSIPTSTYSMVGHLRTKHGDHFAESSEGWAPLITRHVALHRQAGQLPSGEVPA